MHLSMAWEGTYDVMQGHYDNHSRKVSDHLLTRREGGFRVGGPGGAGVPLYCKSHLHIFSQKFGGPGVASSRGSRGGLLVGTVFPAYSIRLCVFLIFLSFFFILGVDFLLKVCYNVLTLKGT